MRYCAVSVYYPLNPVAGDTRGALEPRVYRSLARVARLTEFQKKSFVRSEVNCWMDVIKKKQQQTLFCYLLLSLDFISLKKTGKKSLAIWIFYGFNQSANTKNPENSYTTTLLLQKNIVVIDLGF